MGLSSLRAPSDPILRVPPAPSAEELYATRHVSLVIPVYNGATTVTPLTEALFESNPGYRLQVVLVNDGSSDGSASACRVLSRTHPGAVTFVDLARNSGEHNAVMAGLAHARGDYCVVMDDDFQNPPVEAYRLVEAAVAGKKDIVFSVYPRKRHAFHRNLASRLANAGARSLMDLPEGLYLSSFKCLSRFVVDHIVAYRGPFPYIDGLALRVTRNLAVVETLHEESRKASSGYTLGKLFHLWASSAVNFSILPLRAASVGGVIFSALGVVGSAFVIAEKWRNPGLPVGWPSLIVAILLLSGIQLLILGVIGEYLGQLVLTVNGTPQYVIRGVHEEEAGGEGEGGGDDA
jgi:undecaprenyl-phosphate 4-deoxy-4-formamido-L-arabinose transferase